jgi:hypothetical protein
MKSEFYIFHSLSLLSLFSNKKFWKVLIVSFPLIRHGPHRKRRVQQFSYCYTCIICRGNVFTEPLPSNNRGIHTQTQTDGRDLWSAPLKWAQAPSFIKTGSSIRELIGGGFQTYRRSSDFITLLLFFHNKGSSLLRAGLWDHHAVSVYENPLIYFRMSEPIFMKLGMGIKALEPDSTGYVINYSHQSVSVNVFPYRC